MKQALHYSKKKDAVSCLLCPRRCLLKEGQVGFCGVRFVKDGELYTENYALCAALNWDPVEKKPLYHFHPGQQILSLGTYGCNLNCTFCQNWSLARGKSGSDALKVTPAQVLAMLQREGSCAEVVGAAYTYNEPIVWYEYILDTARLLHEKGYRNVLVTNGFISPKALQELLPFIDALNIDVKAFSDVFYEKYCRGMRRPVLETVELAAAAVHVEVTCLLIPTLNDSPGELEQLTEWLAGINPDLPLHFSRYFPQYKMDLPPTPLETMETAREIARQKLRYVYLGNVDLPGGSDTFCPRCGALLITRRRYRTRIIHLDGNRCLHCGALINIVNGPL
ncbi:MAG: AmmeMemoRadiSam system radical SAM enzyme [Firmicutes bacterium]|nr:AmmeMemoRadiSam system radical SAM enzyme [Bacillota bacterium]